MGIPVSCWKAQAGHACNGQRVGLTGNENVTLCKKQHWLWRVVTQVLFTEDPILIQFLLNFGEIFSALQCVHRLEMSIVHVDLQNDS